MIFHVLVNIFPHFFFVWLVKAQKCSPFYLPRKCIYSIIVKGGLNCYDWQNEDIGMDVAMERTKEIVVKFLKHNWNKTKKVDRNNFAKVMDFLTPAEVSTTTTILNKRQRCDFLSTKWTHNRDAMPKKIIYVSRATSYLKETFKRVLVNYSLIPTCNCPMVYMP